MIILDTIDEKILNELVKNAKIPLRELAKKLKVSAVTIMNRIRKLEQQKIITSYSALIDFDKLGYDVHVIMEMKIEKGKMIELEKKLAKFPTVSGVYDTTGEYDAEVIARFKSTRTLDSFVKKIQSLEFVERTNTKLVLNAIKEGQIEL